MERVLTVLFDKSNRMHELLQEFDQEILKKQFRVIRKESLRNGKQMYEVAYRSEIEKAAIVSKVMQLGSIFGIKVSVKDSPSKAVHKTSQQVTVPQQMRSVQKQKIKQSVSEQKDDNSDGTGVFETLSQSSEEFEVLQNEEEGFTILRQQPFIDSPQKIAEESVIESSKLVEVDNGNDKGGDNVKLDTTEDVFEGNNSSQQINELLDSNDNPDVQADAQVDTQLDATGERLFRYFTGKDDYTQVFKVQQESLYDETGEKQYTKEQIHEEIGQITSKHEQTSPVKQSPTQSQHYQSTNGLQQGLIGNTGITVMDDEQQSVAIEFEVAVEVEDNEEKSSTSPVVQQNIQVYIQETPLSQPLILQTEPSNQMEMDDETIEDDFITKEKYQPISINLNQNNFNPSQTTVQNHLSQNLQRERETIQNIQTKSQIILQREILQREGQKEELLIPIISPQLGMFSNSTLNHNYPPHPTRNQTLPYPASTQSSFNRNATLCLVLFVALVGWWLWV